MRCHAWSSDLTHFANCHIFLDSCLPLSVKYFMHGRKTFITRHSVIQRRFYPNYIYSAHAGCYSPLQELSLCWPLRLDTPCTWKDYPCHLSSRRDDLRLSCLLTQSLMPLESIANLNDAIIVIWLRYITFSLTCGLRTVYLINLKNWFVLILPNVKSSFVFYLTFYT